MHPQFYFNNIGILHLRFQKYRMATFYFSKALKFIETSQIAAAPATNGSAEAKPGS
jgi:F0F1-type ATP synthase assembly protein I